MRQQTCAPAPDSVAAVLVARQHILRETFAAVLTAARRVWLDDGAVGVAISYAEAR